MLPPDWLPNFKFCIPDRPDTPFIDVYQHLLEWEERPTTRWDLEKVEAYAGTSEVVFVRLADDAMVNQRCSSRQALNRSTSPRRIGRTTKLSHTLLGTHDFYQPPS